jgi:hypothetical protein
LSPDTIARIENRLAIAPGQTKAEIEGSLEAGDCAVTHRLKAEDSRWPWSTEDLEGLRAEVEFERVMAMNSAGAETVGGSGSAARTQAAGGDHLRRPLGNDPALERRRRRAV